MPLFQIIKKENSLDAIRQFYTVVVLSNSIVVSPLENSQWSSATISDHISSILYPIKFVHREDAPDLKYIAIIYQLRAQASLLSKEGDLECPSTQEDLNAENRWLP